MNSIISWLQDRRATLPIKVQQIPLANCQPWKNNGRRLSRPDKRFFEGFLAGEEAWILQPEIGILGCLISGTNDSRCLLLQLKEEPGNVGLTQVAPTFQATKSNWERVHGGHKQAYAEFFNTVPEGGFRGAVLNSEQGTKFWQKRNWNTTVEGSRNVPEGSSHRWFSVLEVRRALAESFTVNTDLRSVLASTRWHRLFADSWSEGSVDDHPHMDRLRSAHTLGSSRTQSHWGALQALKKWRGSKRFPRPPVARDYARETSGFWGGRSSGFKFFHVNSRFREVDEWSQPLMVSNQDLSHYLVVAEKRESVSFLLKIRDEVGLHSGPEYGPSVSIDTADDSPQLRGLELEIFDRIQDSGVPLREIVQSDEGGRFFEEVARYSLVWLDIPSSRDDGRLDSVTELPEYRWVSLDELNMLCATPLTTTNELRTLVSLVIS